MNTPTEALKLAIDTQDAIRNFVGSHGQENTETFLMMEADRALSAVRSALAQQASVPSAEPAALLVRDIANDLGVSALDACNALRPLGFGHYSVNMVITADMARELTRHFGAAPLMANGLTEAETAATASVAGLFSPHQQRAMGIIQSAAAGIDSMRAEVWNAAIEAAALVVQPVPHIDEERTCGEVAAAIRALKSGTAPQAAPAPTVQPLPARLVRFTLRDLKAERKRLDGFISFGNEIKRAAEYDEWIAALEAYCTSQGITAATAKETP